MAMRDPEPRDDPPENVELGEPPPAGGFGDPLDASQAPGGGAPGVDATPKSPLNHLSIDADKGSEGARRPSDLLVAQRGIPRSLSTPAIMSSKASSARVPEPAPQSGETAAGRPTGPNEGHGRRLTAAFEALEAFPALVESRNRLLALVSQDPISSSEVVEAVESDVALIIAVLRLANQVEGRTRGRVDSIVQAVDLLSPEAVQALAKRTRTFDFFERTTVWDAAPERFRLHGLAAQRAAERVAVEVGYENRDRLMVTSLLHDIGKLVLMHAYPGYPSQVHQGARTPEERVHRERRELGVDHALVGGVLARRWGLPKSIASVIERHHSDDATGEAAFVRLADMLAHYAQGGSVSPAELLRVSRVVGLVPSDLRRVMYDLPNPVNGRQRQIDPCPLSTRETEVLRRLAEGKVYKQIAGELMLSTSTVRTHLHNIYGKLGAVDRAQAVLIATERGWL
jgi:putative nucleotidyltransferase with HDIG domain